MQITREDVGEFPHVIEATMVKLVAGLNGRIVRVTMAMDALHPGNRLYAPFIDIAPEEARELADALLRLAALSEATSE